MCYQFPDGDENHNVTIVPPEHSPAILMLVSIPMTTRASLVIEGLKRFAERCAEFVEPLLPSITLKEIRAVLRAAQKAFRMVDIVAPQTPLKILRLDCSHVIHNAECGVSDGASRQSVIMLYHPRAEYIHDRVFIFAHELGHALHLALTGNVGIIPEGYDHFNASLGVTMSTLEEKQEGFADAAAYAILSCGLEEHLPAEFNRAFSPAFVRYFKSITEG
jgi:hypothetical protein